MTTPRKKIIRAVIEWAALGIEILGASVIVAGVVRVAITRGTVRYLFQLDKPGAYGSYKHQMGRSLLLGLEFLMAGDVVRAVALEPTLNNVAVLGPSGLSASPADWPFGIRVASCPANLVLDSAPACSTLTGR